MVVTWAQGAMSEAASLKKLHKWWISFWHFQHSVLAFNYFWVSSPATCPQPLCLSPGTWCSSRIPYGIFPCYQVFSPAVTSTQDTFLHLFLSNLVYLSYGDRVGTGLAEPELGEFWRTLSLENRPYLCLGYVFRAAVRTGIWSRL